MEMVASVKMQKAVKGILTARSYIQNAWNMLVTLAGATNPEWHPLLQRREIKRTLLILAASDRGLCGSYNSDVMRKATSYLKNVISNEVRNPQSSNSDSIDGDFSHSADGGMARNDEAEVDIIAVGKKAAGYARKLAPGSLIAEFPGFEAGASYDDITPIAKIVLDDYINGKYDEAVAIYSHFQSSLKQSPVVKQILPITQEHIDIPELWEEQKDTEKIEYKFEPDPDTVLERILPQLVRVQIYGLILEANASEHSARMVAMKSATDNAKNLIDDLTLTYNTIRQDSITREIAEISGVAESMLSH